MIFSGKAPKISALEVPRTWDDDLLGYFLKGAHVHDPRYPKKTTVEHSVIISGARTSLTSSDKEFVLYGHLPLERADKLTHIERHSVYLQVVIEVHDSDPEDPDNLGWVHIGEYGLNETFAAMQVHLTLCANKRNNFEKSLGFLRAESVMPQLVLRLSVDNPTETSSAKNSSFAIDRFGLDSWTVYNKEWLGKSLIFKRYS